MSNAAAHQQRVRMSVFKAVLTSEVAPENENAVAEHPSMFVMLAPRLLPS